MKYNMIKGLITIILGEIMILLGLTVDYNFLLLGIIVVCFGRLYNIIGGITIDYKKR